MHVALAGVPRPPNVKQHTSPLAQFAALVQERAAPPWHRPVAVQVGVPRPVRGAQQTCVAVSQVEVPQATVPPPDPLLEELPELLLDEMPLLDPELLLDVDPAPLLLEADPPLDDDAELPPELDVDPAPLLPEAAPPLDPGASSTVASSGTGSTPGIRMMSSRGLREPHACTAASARSKAGRSTSGLVGLMDFPSVTVVLREERYRSP
jgi:hypothetical protein